jgi:hypothetical protein
MMKRKQILMLALATWLLGYSATLCPAQTGHSANDIRGTWSAGTLTAVAIIPQAQFSLHSNNAVAWCVFTTNGAATVWSGDITNITPNQVGGNYGTLFATNSVAAQAIHTNIDNTVTNTGSGGYSVPQGSTNAPGFVCEQIDGYVERHTVYAVGIGTSAAGTWIIKLSEP